MKRRSWAPSRALRVTVLTALSLGLLAGGAEAKKAPRDFFGVMPQTVLTDEDYTRMGQAKVGTLRFEISWYGTDPTAAEGDYNFAATDATMTRLAQEGIEPLPFVFGTPAWAAELDGHKCSDAGCIIYAPRRSGGLKAFQGFMTDLVERYGRGGTFWAENPALPENPIERWQIWNEQNSPTFYAPKPKPKAFAKLVKVAHKGVKAADRSAEVILGGMFVSPRQGKKPAMFSFDFLDQLYRVKGVKRTFDGVAAHPYAAQMGKVKKQVELLRDSMVDAGDRKADLWITEVGWASSGPKNPLVRGERGQAQRLKQAFKYFVKKRKSYRIPALIWYAWRDNPAAEVLCVWCPGAGLVTEDLTPKPSLAAYAKFTGGS